MYNDKNLYGSLLRRLKGIMAIMVMAQLGFTGLAQANPDDLPKLHPSIPLVDESGTHVLASGKSYSAKQSCGGCHDYESITHSYHFEAGRDEASDNFGALRGLDALVSPGYFGGYNCMGGNNPDRLAKKSNSSVEEFSDKGAAGWIQRCEGCHSGGGWMEKDRHGNRYDETDPASVAHLDGDYFNRGTDANNQPADLSVVSQWDWKKSGVVEADCFRCHADLAGLTVIDPTISTRSAASMASNVRRKVLIDQGHFRESNSSILEVLNLNTSGDPLQDKTLLSFERADLDGDGTVTDKEVVFDTATGEPKITWNPSAFDAEGRVVIPMLRFPANDNCMSCHRTSNSRRGFYGFGEGAEATFDEETGTLISDYQDDVHKGKSWLEGAESRTIEDCNVCHSRNYFNVSIDVNANHAFLKGNSDMDVRNDLDFNPNAKSCEYCHNDSPNRDTANPSDVVGDGEPLDMLAIHKTFWLMEDIDTGLTDMWGQPEEQVEKIAKTHLDKVSCQACHVTDKVARRTPFEPMYRWREAANGQKTIVPYKPKPRYYWKDNNSGTVLNQTERNSVFETRNFDADGVAIDVDGDGVTDEYGVIVDPVSGEELAVVTVRMSHGSWRFGDPTDYAGFVGLKSAYDSVFAAKGVADSDAVLVWSEINQYLISHNTRPAVSSVQCEECHSRNRYNAFTAGLTSEGLLGGEHSYTVTTVPDPRLVTEGIIVFDYPYMAMDETTGEVTASVADILYHSKADPSMTILKSARAIAVSGVLELMNVAEALAAAGISAADAQLLQEQFSLSEAYRFQASYGDAAIRDLLIMIESSSAFSDRNLPFYRMQVSINDAEATANAPKVGVAALVSDVFSINMIDEDGAEAVLNNPALVKLPYVRTNENLEQVKVVTSRDGISWEALPSTSIAALQPQSDTANGYIAFWTDHFSYYAILDETLIVLPAESSSSGGGGSAGLWLLLFALAGLISKRFGRIHKNRAQTSH